MTENSQQGIIHALLLDGNGGAKSLNINEVIQWTSDLGEIWIHLDYSQAASKEWLQANTQLDDSIIDTLMSNESRPRFTSLENGVLIAWRGVNLNPRFNPEDMVGIRLCYQPNQLISSLSRELHSVNELLKHLKNKTGPKTLSELLVNLSDKMVFKIGDIVDEFEEEMSEIEDLVIASEKPMSKSQLSDFRRQVIAIRRYLLPQKEALIRFSIEKVEWLDSNQRILLRKVADRVTRQLEDLEAIRARAMVAQEELQNRIAE